MFADARFECFGEVDELLGGDPALGDEGVPCRGKGEGSLALFDLDGQLLFGRQQEVGVFLAERVDVVLDALDLPVEVGAARFEL